MNYLAPTPEIEEIGKKVLRYKARSKKEDRGDGFKEGTPEEIMELRKRISEFYDQDHSM